MLKLIILMFFFSFSKTRKNYRGNVSLIGIQTDVETGFQVLVQDVTG